jgi:hypothetical protein
MYYNHGNLRGLFTILTRLLKASPDKPESASVLFGGQETRTGVRSLDG